MIETYPIISIITKVNNNMKNMNDIEYLTGLMIILQKALAQSPEGKKALSELLDWMQTKLSNNKFDETTN